MSAADGDAPAHTPRQVLAKLHALYPTGSFTAHIPDSLSGFSPSYLAAAAAETDFVYRCAALWTSHALKRGNASGRVWQYDWAWCDEPCKDFIKHGSENRYVFFDIGTMPLL